LHSSTEVSMVKTDFLRISKKKRYRSKFRKKSFLFDQKETVS
jgi:hypothetical protein